MAKLGSFLRRLFTSLTSDDDCSSSPSASFPNARKSVVIIPPLTPPLVLTTITTSRVTSTTIRSCSASPRPPSRIITKQTTIPIPSTNNGYSNSNFPLSNTKKHPNRRLSAPLIMHASTHRRQQRSAIVDASIEKALISPLQRLSLSSTPGHPIYHNNSIYSLGTSSPNTSPRNGVLSSSLNLSSSNSINLPNSLNNTSPLSGTPPSQIPAGASSSSPRVSIQSNNSTSPTSDRKMSLQTRGRRPSMFDPIDPKELQQALYASAALKATLPLNLTNEDEASRALSRITISYDRDSGHVFIDTLSFENLQVLDGIINNNNGDFITFYCRFRLLPERRSLFQTKMIRLTRLQSSYLLDKKQLNEFHLSYDQLNNHSIEIFIYKINTIKPLFKDIRIATVKYDLNELLTTDQSRMKKPLDEYSAQSTTTQDPDLGELLVSLSYLQSAAKLSVVVLEAKNLRPLSIETKSYPDACVKVTLYDRNGKKLKRKKTSVQRTSDCPIFNEELVFELRRDVASEVIIDLRLVHESLAYKEQLGSVVFGPIVNNIKGSVCPENIYWSTILSGESLNAQWHMLKPSIKIVESK